MKTKIVSLNVNLLRSTNTAIPKRRKLFTWLKNMSAGVILLQETHSDQQLGDIICNEWGGKCFFAHGDNKSRGVAIFLHPRSRIEPSNISYDKNGRYIIMHVEINGTATLLANIYGPNHDDPTVFQDFSTILSALVVM